MTGETGDRGETGKRGEGRKRILKRLYKTQDRKRETESKGRRVANIETVERGDRIGKKWKRRDKRRRERRQDKGGDRK